MTIGVTGAAVAAFAPLSACGDPAEKAAQDFAAALDEAPGCTSNAQCTVLFTECPLGCAHAVASDAVDVLHERAHALVERYRGAGGNCAYDCDTPPPVACTAGRCSFVSK